MPPDVERSMSRRDRLLLRVQILRSGCDRSSESWDRVGEKFIEMNWIFLSSLLFCAPISVDILFWPAIRSPCVSLVLGLGHEGLLT